MFGGGNDDHGSHFTGYISNIVWRIVMFFEAFMEEFF